MVSRSSPVTRGRKAQRGGFFLGAVFGLLVGLAVALGVALYVNKVPIPFVDKVPQRTAEQDAAEAEKNRNWDPNTTLYGKGAAKPTGAASAVAGTGVTVAGDVASAAASAPASRASAAAAVREEASKALAKSGAASAAPDKASSAKSDAAAFMYYVQVGAYARDEDAEQQRAKLSLAGLVGRVTEREQAGKLMYRVRVGPYETRTEAEEAKDQAAGAGFPDATLVRVQR